MRMWAARNNDGQAWLYRYSPSWIRPRGYWHSIYDHIPIDFDVTKGTCVEVAVVPVELLEKLADALEVELQVATEHRLEAANSHTAELVAESNLDKKSNLISQAREVMK